MGAPAHRSADVVVVGAGIAGLTFAGLLAADPAARRRQLRVVVLDHRPPPSPPADLGLRVLALAPACRQILLSAGAWQRLPPDRVSPYRKMRIWQAADEPRGRSSLVFDAADLGLPDLGCIVEHDRLRHLLWEQATAVDGVEALTGVRPVALRMEAGDATLTFDDGRSLSARLVVGADGADSWVRSQLGIGTSGRSYGQRAVVAHVASERPHEETAWQCFRATGPVALLPLADGRSSVVWSCADDEARSLLDGSDDEFAGRLGAATSHVLGTLAVRSARAAFPLAVRHTHRYTGARFALLGDAAHQIHPLAGQGSNLGVLGAAALAATLAAHLATSSRADPGDQRALRRYERGRKGANLLTLGTMEGLHRLFTGGPLIARFGGLGLGLVDRATPLKRLLALQALGRLAGVPAAEQPDAGRTGHGKGHRSPDAEI